MRMNIFPSQLKGEFTPPISKSWTERVIIAALCSGCNVSISDYSPSDDVSVFIDCAEKLGASFDGKTLVAPKEISHFATLNCGESGAALRFFSCLCAAVGGEYLITGASTLLRRPMDALVSLFEENGVTVSKSASGLKISGKLKGDVFTVNSELSSQYLSGMLLAAPLLGRTVKIKSNCTVGRAYVDMTLAVMDSFGIECSVNGEEYTVSKGKYCKKGALIPQLDWSGAASIIAAAAISGDVTIRLPYNANGLRFSGDARIIDILKNAGAEVSMGENFVRVKAGRLLGITLDCDEHPDLAPIAAVIGAYSVGKTYILNANRLRYKESDRVKAILDMITDLGGKAQYFDGKIVIFGQKLTGGTVKTYSDHRIAMAASIAALGAQNKTEIDDGDCVKKSYSNYWQHYRALGGIAESEEV